MNWLNRLRPGPRAGAWAAGLALIWLAVAGIQQLRGLPGWTVQFPVKAAEIRPEPKAKGVWKAPVPKDYRSWLSNKRGVLLENDRMAGRRSASVAGVLKDSGGMYVIHHAFVRWRTSDGSDPRKSGRPYLLELPAVLPAWTLWGGLGLLFWGWSARRPGPGETGAARAGFFRLWPCRRLDVLVAVILTGVTGMAALSRVGDLEQTNEGAMMIKGLPYSDAACWYDMAVSLAEGRGLASGFDGQRPWYSVMMAMVHAVRGLAVENGLIVNALALALAAGMLYVLGRFLHSRLAGIGAAGVLMLSHQHRLWAATLVTETAGLALTILSIALILTAVSLTPPGRPRGLWVAGLALGGLFQALGNLTCPYTLAATPFYGILLLHEGRRMTANWRTWRVLQPGLIYAAGFLLAMGPWLARQHQVHGLVTLSTQTADLLYGATFEEGPMKPRQMKELYAHLDEVGHTAVARYRFSMSRFTATVREDPLKYAGRLAAGALAFFGYFNVSGPEPAAAALLVVLAGLWGRRREPARLMWVLSGAGVLALTVWLIRLPATIPGPGPLLGLTLSASVLAWTFGPRAGRPAVLWVAATLAGCMMINALTGNLIANRCWMFCDWCLWLLVLAAVQGTHDRLGWWLAARIRQPAVEPEAVQDFTGIRRCTIGVAALLLLLQAAGGALLIHRQRHPVVVMEEPGAEEAARIRAWAENRFAAEAARAAATTGLPLQIHWVRLGEGACFLEANEEPTLFSRAFVRQPQARTLRLVRGIPPRPGTAAPGWMARFPGDARALPEDRPGWLVSWMSVDRKANLGQDEEILEVLAFLPADAAGRTDETQAILFPPSPAPPAPAPDKPGTGGGLQPKISWHR